MLVNPTFLKKKLQNIYLVKISTNSPYDLDIFYVAERTIDYSIELIKRIVNSMHPEIVVKILSRHQVDRTPVVLRWLKRLETPKNLFYGVVYVERSSG